MFCCTIAIIRLYIKEEEMKKFTKILMTGLLSAMLLASCGNSQQNTDSSNTGSGEAPSGAKK